MCFSFMSIFTLKDATFFLYKDSSDLIYVG